MASDRAREYTHVEAIHEDILAGFAVAAARALSRRCSLFAGCLPPPAQRRARSPEQTAAVDEIAQLYQWLPTLQGEFTQIGPKGNGVAKACSICSKPGKMRFEYASPNPFIIVSDGTWVTIKNRAKDKADQYPLSQTPLAAGSRPTASIS